VNAAIVALYKHHRFTKNRPITQQTDRNILEAFRQKHGNKRIAMLEQQHIEAMIGEKAGTPSSQRNLLRVLRVLLGVAVKLKMRRDNPALGIKLDTIKGAGYHSWTEAELRQYETRHPVGTKARLALDLLLYTAGRRADIVRLGPPNMRDGRFKFTASKNRADLDIPVAPPLAATIAATPMLGVKTFLVTEYGRSFTPAGFGNWFRDRCNEAGLPHCSAHGLRKALLRRMAEAGCSEDFIASISGHKDYREIRTYVQAANKAALRSDLIDPTIALHHGRVVKRTGDGVLIEFRSVVDAVRCAIEIQNGMVERNTGVPPSAVSSSGWVSTWAMWSKKAMATSWAMASTSQHALKGLLIRAVSVFPRTPIAKCVIA
jgi:integrase